jgi:hypothetical protein
MALLLSAVVIPQAPAASPNPVDAEVSTILREHMEKPGHPTDNAVVASWRDSYPEIRAALWHDNECGI